MMGFPIKAEWLYHAVNTIRDWIKGTSNDKPKVEVSGEVEVDGSVTVKNFPETQKVVADHPLPVSLYGTIEGLLADRPNPGTVPIGTRYWAVDTGEYAVSTGTTWRVLGVV